MSSADSIVMLMTRWKGLTDSLYALLWKLGPPQVLSEVSSRYVSVERGEDAIISAIFCADPRPTKVSWRWASFQMEAGDGSGRYVAEALHKVTPTLPPLVSDDVDDNVMANEEATEFYDAVIDLEVDRYETTAFNRHAPRPLIEALPTAEAVASSPTVPPQTPHAIFTYPVCNLSSQRFILFHLYFV